MDSFRVCHVIHDTQCGGTESMLFKVLQELQGRFEFSVISLIGCGEIGKAIQGLGIPVHSLHGAERGKARPHRLFRAVTKLREISPDIVQTWAYHADLIGGIAAKVATRAGIVWNIRHATLAPKLDSKNVLRSAQLCGRISKWVPDRILLNAQSAVRVHSDVGYDESKMHVIPNGFDTHVFREDAGLRAAIRDELKIPSDATVVGMCGRFHAHKGQQDFVGTAVKLSEKFPNAHFILAGRGCDNNNQELDGWIPTTLRNQFHLLGSRTDIPAILNAMDVYLLPSLTEGMPNVIGESMACGTPVVATDVGDAGKLMGQREQLIRPRDTEGMARGVERILRATSDQLDGIREQGKRRIAEHFEMRAIAEQYASVWQTVRKKKKTKSAVAQRKLTLNQPVSSGGSQTRPKLVHVTTVPMTQWFFLRGQLQFMTQQGFDVHSISSPGDYLDRIATRDPVTTHGIAISRKISPLKDVTAMVQLFRRFRQLRPEIVQLSTPKAALLGAIAAFAARVPIRIYQIRGLSSESETGCVRWIYQRLERLTATLCNGCLVNAESLHEYAKQAQIIQSGLVARQGMSNGVDLERFSPRSTQPADLRSWNANWTEGEGSVIGFLGRLTRDKGLEEIYHAWLGLREDYPDAHLLLVGPHETENPIDRRCYEDLMSDPRVTMTGTQHDVVPLYRRMDIFVYPSHGTEGFPNAPMEAAAMQLPVIATRVVGCVDAVAHGKTGQIIAPRNHQELEAALRIYLDQPTLRAQHGRAGRERIRTGFAPQDLWHEFHAYYVHLLRRGQLDVPRQDFNKATESKRAA